MSGSCSGGGGGGGAGGGGRLEHHCTVCMTPVPNFISNARVVAPIALAACPKIHLRLAAKQNTQ